MSSIQTQQCLAIFRRSWVSSLSNVSSASPSVKVQERFRIEALSDDADEGCCNLVSDVRCDSLYVAMLALKLPPDVIVYYGEVGTDWGKVRNDIELSGSGYVIVVTHGENVVEPPEGIDRDCLVCTVGDREGGIEVSSLDFTALRKHYH